MPEPSYAATVAQVVPIVNQAMATEFNLKSPFSRDPLPGERFGVLAVNSLKQQTIDFVAFDCQLWLVEGFQTYSDYTAGSIRLGLWLLDSFPTIRKAAQGVKRVFAFYPGGYTPNAINYPIIVPLSASSRRNNEQQRADWTLDILMPCTLVVAAKYCP